MSDESSIPLLHVGPAKAADGLDIRQRAGWNADTIMSELNPKWFEWMVRGFLFWYPSAAAGVALAAAGNNQPTIWNPAGSGVLFVPLRVILGYVSTTHAAGHAAWATQQNMGSALGTAAPFSIFTNIVPTNALLGSGKTSKVRFSTTQTWSAAPTYLRPTGPSFAALAAATAVDVAPKWWDEDGGFGVAPGSAIQLCANAAVAGIYASAILGLEFPLPPGWDG